MIISCVTVIRSTTVNFLFIVSRPHWKIFFQDTAWKFIIWLTARKKIIRVLSKTQFYKKWNGTRHINITCQTELESKHISININIVECVKCAKFNESLAIVGSSSIVPSCLPGQFVGPEFVLVGISWVSIFSSGYFMGPKFFPVGISGVQNFL